MDATKHQMAVYAILDTIADQLIGGLVHYKHDAAAVRFFSDVAAMKESLIAKHPQDFDLIRLGYITHHHEMEPNNAVILKGSMWAAAQNDHGPLQLEA